MIRTKIKVVICAGIVLWAVVFVQMGITRFLYNDINISQAYARNQMELVNCSIECKADLGDKGIDKMAWNKKFGKTITAKTIPVNQVNYLHVKSNENMGIHDIRETKEKLVDALNQHKIQDYELITLTECRYVGEMTSEEKQKLVRRLFRYAGAITVSTNENDSYFSAYGYTIGEKDSIIINGKRVNVNIVIRYDEKSDRSNIMIGTPYINVDY
jgi:hypothetical protein